MPPTGSARENYYYNFFNHDRNNRKKEIVPTLRKMAVGECEVFPLSQARSIGSTIYGANLAVERANGYKWSAKTNIEKKTVTVTRTQ